MREKLLTDIRRVDKKVDKKWLPLSDYERYGYYSRSQIKKEFGKWSDALDAAGCMSPQKFHSKEHILDDIRRVMREMNRPITRSQYKKQGRHNPRTVKRKFGSWSEAVEEARNGRLAQSD